MKLLDQNSQQKLRGGYYTPSELSDFIINWALSDGEKHNILEPSCGDGVFLESLLKHKGNTEFSCTAIELNKEEAEKSINTINNHVNINVINDDFFKVFNDILSAQKYDLIIGNPPYIRYQYLSPEQRNVQSNILVANNMKSNKLINAWVSFVVASVQILNDGGKIGFVIPAELLQVAYAEELRLFLMDNLSKVTVITFEDLIFPDVQQEVVILLGEKNYTSSGSSTAEISLIEVKELSDLNNKIFNSPIEYKQVDHTREKWTKYFLTNNEIGLVRGIQSHSKFLKFIDVAHIDIGITTGNNKYFSVEQETVQRYDLSSYTIPLIGRSAHANGVFFNHEDWIENVEKGLRSQLLYFADEPTEYFSKLQQAYIHWGEYNKHNEGYKLGLRKHWYHIPSVWIPDAFFLRRNDRFPKFVLNNINAVSTDTMHRIRFKNNLNSKKVLLSYYNSITFASTEIEGRSYGGGVLEILPGELEKIILPDLQSLDDNTTDYLLNRIDQTLRSNGEIEEVLDEIDRVVLVQHLALDPNDVVQFREIWRKLMNRRRNRK